MFICPAENTIKVAALVNSAHAVDTDGCQGLECHIACAHYCLADIVQAVVAVEDDLFRGHVCNAFGVIGKAKEVLGTLSKMCSIDEYRWREGLPGNGVGETWRLHILLLFRGYWAQGERQAGCQ
jgi:hypothetical protein